MDESRTPLLGRIAALIVGVAILGGAARATFGLVLCAPLGVWVAYRFRRARRRPLGAWTGLFSAVGAVVIALLLIGSIVASRLPAGTWSRIRQAADSASAQSAKQPPPAWLDRLAPGAAARASTTKAPEFGVAGMILGFWFLAGFLGIVIGTIGWSGTMLLVFSASGRWLREPSAVTVETGVG